MFLLNRLEIGFRTGDQVPETLIGAHSSGYYDDGGQQCLRAHACAYRFHAASFGVVGTANSMDAGSSGTKAYSRPSVDFA